MKTLKISIFAAALGLMSFATLPTHNDPIVKTKTASAVAWKSETIEIGNIPQGTPKSVDFEFKNTGKTDVIITNVKASCGCTATDYTKTPIKPGQSGKVTATYNAANKGAFTKTVTVTTNAEETPKTLTIKGTVI
ncbi:DUF1573 domain-containing protein [Flavobacterium caeni]|uniref:DUF1573 domain-containing protein n=1 Tax=Flavobacterium caeni TaxID=490189 RepID=A0A1G5ANS0_9FLAO|nr:DUF1573 domain-containing protein [Flavobacterium caeni]SCX79528.1 Protein of unknown function [Flavobacterium caeni]